MSILQADGITFGNSTQLNTYYGILPESSTMVFYQASAPTGWTKNTSHNDKALRVVSGTGGGSAGSLSFSGVLNNTTGAEADLTTTISGSIGPTTLTTQQIPAHTHNTGSTGRFTSSAGSSPFRTELRQPRGYNIRAQTRVQINNRSQVSFRQPRTVRQPRSYRQPRRQRVPLRSRQPRSFRVRYSFRQRNPFRQPRTYRQPRSARQRNPFSYRVDGGRQRNPFRQPRSYSFRYETWSFNAGGVRVPGLIPIGGGGVRRSTVDRGRRITRGGGGGWGGVGRIPVGGGFPWQTGGFVRVPATNNSRVSVRQRVQTRQPRSARSRTPFSYRTQVSFRVSARQRVPLRSRQPRNQRVRYSFRQRNSFRVNINFRVPVNQRVPATFRQPRSYRAVQRYPQTSQVRVSQRVLTPGGTIRGVNTNGPATSSTGGGQAHTHPFTGSQVNFVASLSPLRVQYVDVIICSLDDAATKFGI